MSEVSSDTSTPPSLLKTREPAPIPNSHPRRAIPGINDVVTLAPELALKFSPASPTKAHQVTPNSNKKALFSCPSGHDWEARISTVNNGGACTYCAHLAVLSGYNDVSTIYPKLTRYYSPDNPLPPDQVLAGGKTKHLWNCLTCQGAWKSTAADLSKSRGCPYCNGWKTLPGHNDLKSRYPDAAQQWSYLNATTPDQVAPHSNKAYWWTCSSHGDWKAPPNRVTSGSSCPTCAENSFKSRGEEEVRLFLETITGDSLSSDRNLLSGLELDVYIPRYGVAVEYNGDYWHSDKVLGKMKNTTAIVYHQNKVDLARDVGVNLAFVWDSDWRHSRKMVEEALILFLHEKRLDPVLSKLEGPLDAAQGNN